MLRGSARENIHATRTAPNDVTQWRVAGVRQRGASNRITNVLPIRDSNEHHSQ
jgi:hypothetical protein